MYKVIVGVFVLAVFVFVGGAYLWQKGDRAPSGEQFLQNPPVTSGDNAPPGSIHNMPVPPAVAAARTTVAQLVKVNESEVLILTAHEKEWPDSCLGLAAADEFCLQVITSGYEVTLRVKGQEYVYRTNSDGSVLREQH